MYDPMTNANRKFTVNCLKQFKAGVTSTHWLFHCHCYQDHPPRHIMSGTLRLLRTADTELNRTEMGSW